MQSTNKKEGTEYISDKTVFVDYNIMQLFFLIN